MFFCIFKWIILSVALISLIHYLYSFLIKTLTVPKVRDLIHKPQEQYNDLFKNIILNSKKNTNTQNEEEEMSLEINNYVAALKNSN
jgi:hypothetical protein